MSETIKLSEIKYSSSSLCDKIGRVFFHEGRVFREINKDYEDRILAFLSSDLFNQLIVNHFIPKTYISNRRLDNGNMVLEHEKVQVSAPSDWSFSMLKEAAIFLLELNAFLKNYGYHLYDGHLWNICFHNNHPQLIDFGTLVPIEAGSCFDVEFIHTCGYPLMLYTQNESYLAKALLSSPSNIYQRTIPSQTIEESAAVSRCLRRFFNHIKLSNCFKKIERLERQFLSPSFIRKHMNFNLLNKTMWDDYQNDFFKDIEEGKLNQRFARYEVIKNLIAEYCSDAESLTDLAGNMGAMCYYLEKFQPMLKKFVNIDYDEKAIEISYAYLQSHSSVVNTIVGNFMLPSRNSFIKDFKSDIVLAMAVTHHLTLTQGFYLSAVFEKIKSYTNKYVFIEFMPWGLWGGGERPEVPDWYNLDWFKQTFEQYFELIHIKDFGKNRILFIGKIIGKNNNV